MKNLLTLLSIAILSTAAQAEGSALESTLLQIENTVDSQFVLVKNTENNSILLQTLDTDQDGFVSKIEAASSEEISSSWNTLDINKDNKLDTEELAQFLTQEN